jgi:uncharacterized membrane protein/nitrite reductase/ring-hydroxylating ferredoxin subunit
MRARAQIKSHPIHPFLVAFPIGLFITSFAFDLIGVNWQDPSLWAAAWYCIIAGLCAGALAAIPGAVDLLTVVPPSSSGRSRGYRHAVLNVVVIGLFVAVAARRSGPIAAPDGTSLVLSAIGIFVLAISGWLGGTLVYSNQIAVNHRYANAGRYREVALTRWDQPVCKAEDLADGQMLLADIAGTRIAVGRCGDDFVAFSDRCTHTGGPLSDGALVACTVQCPWHGSQFNVRTGAVVNGPANNPVETFDAEVREGEIYIRPKKGEEKRAA